MRVWFNHWFSTAYHLINLINLIKENNSDKFTFVGSNKNDYAIYKRICEEWYLEPSDINETDYVDYCLNFCKQHQIDIFVPRRCLEIGNNHILDSDIASEIHKFVEQNYGLIGRQWIEFISKNKNLFINEYERFINDDSIKEKFNEKFPDHFYLTIAAFVTFKIFETNFCNITEDKAYTETMNSILELAEDLPNVAEDTNAARAVVVIRDYIEKYKSDFATENEVPSKRQIKGYFKTLKGISCTGIKRADVLAILKTANFDPNQTMREFQEESIIIVDKNRKDGTKNINFNGVSNSVVLFLNEKLDTNIESSEYSEE